MAIINLTQHAATPEQQAEGVFDLAGDALSHLRDLLTFDALPTKQEIEDRASQIAALAVLEADPAEAEHRQDSKGYAYHAMIGGAPFLMAPLEAALLDQGITPVYAFSRRESVEQAQPDGSVRKVNVFRHAGFVGL